MNVQAVDQAIGYAASPQVFLNHSEDIDSPQDQIILVREWLKGCPSSHEQIASSGG